MKKILIFIFICISCIAYSQNRELNDSTFFISNINPNGKYYKSLDESLKSYSFDYDIVENKTPVLLVDYNSNGVFKGFLSNDYNNPIFIKENDFSDDKENLYQREYLKINQNGDLDLRINTAKYIITSLLIKESEKKIKMYEDYQKKGLVITSKDYAYEDYSDAFGLELEFYNGYKKTIKYIDFTVRSYNQVGDPQSDYFGKSVVRPQIIGPLHFDNFSTITFDKLFYDVNDVISYLVITYMKVTFMDGTTKEIKNVNNNLGEDVYNGKGK